MTETNETDKIKFSRERAERTRHSYIERLQPGGRQLSCMRWLLMFSQ